jgi:hypothetical protein
MSFLKQKTNNKRKSPEKVTEKATSAITKKETLQLWDPRWGELFCFIFIPDIRLLMIEYYGICAVDVYEEIKTKRAKLEQLQEEKEVELHEAQGEYEATCQEIEEKYDVANTCIQCVYDEDFLTKQIQPVMDPFLEPIIKQLLKIMKVRARYTSTLKIQDVKATIKIRNMEMDSLKDALNQQNLVFLTELTREQRLDLLRPYIARTLRKQHRNIRIENGCISCLIEYIQQYIE